MCKLWLTEFRSVKKIIVEKTSIFYRLPRNKMAAEKEGKDIKKKVASKAASQLECTETDVHETAFTSDATEISKAFTQGFFEMISKPSADTELLKQVNSLCVRFYVCVPFYFN